MNILFVCKYNRFRSKVAEVFFNFYNRNKKHKVKSRGTEPDYIPVAESVKKVLKEFGIKNIDKKPRKLSRKAITWADLIIITADNVDLDLKPKNKKILKWEISDTSQSNVNGIKVRAKNIEKRIKKLVSVLG